MAVVVQELCSEKLNLTWLTSIYALLCEPGIASSPSPPLQHHNPVGLLIELPLEHHKRWALIIMMYHCLQLYYLIHIFILLLLPYFHHVTLPIPHLLQAVDITAGQKASVTFISILCFCAVANARCRWSSSVSFVHLERNIEDRRMLQ
jgi:hypothetical protein